MNLWRRPTPEEPTSSPMVQLCEMLDLKLQSDHQLTGLSVGDIREATAALRYAIDEARELRAALEPFAEIARRLAWNKYDAEDMRLDDHVIEAPAPDVGPDCAYCLMIGAFWRAARLLDDRVQLSDHPAGGSFARVKRKRWWQRHG
jgi:hypothetical protein